MGFLKRLLKETTRTRYVEVSGDPRLCVYVIGFEDPLLSGVAKIGVTTDIKRRIATLQTGCPWRLEVKGVLYRTDAYALEKWLHAHFGEFRIREDGEWFSWPDGIDPLTEVERVT